MTESNERMHILEMIENGRISAKDGLLLLAALSEAEDAEFDNQTTFPRELPPAPQTVLPLEESTEPPKFTSAAGEPQSEAGSDDETGMPLQPEVFPAERAPDIDKWRRYWMIPLWIGVAITVLGGIWMFGAMQSSGFGFWFVCATIPFIVGLFILVLGWQSRTAHWLHLRVQQPPGERPQRIAISFPIPLGLAAWFFRTFRKWIPGLDSVPEDIDGMLQAVKESTSPDNPIYIEVDEGDGQEKVQIYIG